MGQARLRGTLEQRRAEGIAKREKSERERRARLESEWIEMSAARKRRIAELTAIFYAIGDCQVKWRDGV